MIRRDRKGSEGIRRDWERSGGIGRDWKGSGGIGRDREGSRGIERDREGSGGIKRDQEGSCHVSFSSKIVPCERSDEEHSICDRRERGCLFEAANIESHVHERELGAGGDGIVQECPTGHPLQDEGGDVCQ